MQPHDRPNLLSLQRKIPSMTASLIQQLNPHMLIWTRRTSVGAKSGNVRRTNELGDDNQWQSFSSYHGQGGMYYHHGIPQVHAVALCQTIEVYDRAGKVKYLAMEDSTIKNCGVEDSN